MNDGRAPRSEVARRGRVPVWDRKWERCKVTTATAMMALRAAYSRVNIANNTHAPQSMYQLAWYKVRCGPKSTHDNVVDTHTVSRPSSSDLELNSPWRQHPVQKATVRKQSIVTLRALENTPFDNVVLEFGILKIIFYNRSRGTISRRKAENYHTLSPGMEDALSQWVNEMTARGFPFRLDPFKAMAAELTP